MKKCSNMSELRTEIDRVDQLIVPLLVERLGYIGQAGDIKQCRDTVRDEWRIEDVVAKAKAAADSGTVDMIEDVYRFLINWSIEHEYVVFDALKAPKD